MDKDFLSENKRIYLDMGKVSKVAEVYLNGKPVGIAWHAPYRLDITDYVKPGENNLVIDVANVISNYLTGDDQLPEQYQRTSSSVQKGPNAWTYPWKDVPLVESGLLGPVRVVFGEQLSIGN